jgi:hypothetical protein
VTAVQEFGPEDVLRLAIILLPVAAVVVGGVVLLWFFRCQRRRRRWMEMRQVADELGLRAAPQAEDDERRWELCAFNLLRPGTATRREFRHRQAGTIGGAEVEVFDVERRMNTRPVPEGRPERLPEGELHAAKRDYVVDSDETAVLVRRPCMNLPPFLLSPDSAQRRFLEGRRGEPLEDAFEKHNAFEAHDVEEVQALFSWELRGHLSDNTDLTLEGRGEMLLCYREGRRLSAAEIYRLVDEALWIAEQLHRAPR